MNDITNDFFEHLGITKGVTVLDVGCGRGVTTELIAELVGSTGKVIGLDANPNAISAAQSNAQSKKLHQIEYRTSDLMDLNLADEQFDFIVGRRILKYLANPKAVIQKLSGHLNAHGTFGFQEHDSTSMIDKEKMPMHHKVNQWIWELVKCNSGNTNIGKDLWDIFDNESISITSIRPEAVVQTPENDVSIISILQTLSGLLVAKGIVTENDINHQLMEDLTLEKKTSNSVFIRELIFFLTAEKN